MKFNSRYLENFNEREIGLGLDFSICSSTIPLIALDGILDSENAMFFSDAVIKTIDANCKLKFFIFNLENLNYISSTGIGSFTTILVHAKKHNVVLYLTRLNEKTRLLFNHLGLVDFFNIIDDVHQVETGSDYTYSEN